jgi:hypothetical protein
MIRYLKSRFHAYIQGIMAENVSAIAELAAMHVPDPNILDLASKVQLQMDIDPIAERVVDLVTKTDHAIEYETLAECVSIEELARQFDVADIAGEVDHSEIASALDTSDIAGEISVSDLAGELDAEDIAGHIDMDSVAEYIDYQKLAVALLHAVKSGAL